MSSAYFPARYKDQTASQESMQQPQGQAPDLKKNNENLDWKKRHTELNPAWFERSIFREAAGGLLVALSTIDALGAILAGCALAAGTFLAAPAILIAGGAALAVSSVAFATIGGGILTYPKSWNDPQTRVQAGKAAEKAIRQERLGYKDVMKRYGGLIENYKILTNADLNLLFRREIQSDSIFPETAYRTIIGRHGEGLLEMLDSENRLALRKKFLDMLRHSAKSENKGTEGILNSHLRAMVALNVTKREFYEILLPREIQKVLSGQAGFSSFIERNSVESLAYIPPIYKDRVKEKFLEYIQNKNAGIKNIQEAYPQALSHLHISNEEIERRILPQELESLESGLIDYSAFKERNGVSSIGKAIIKEMESAEKPNTRLLAAKFLSMPASKMAHADFKEDREVLAIDDNAIKTALIQDADSLSYFGDFGFRAKRGLEAAALIEEKKAVLKTKILAEMKGWSYPAIAHYLEDIKEFGITNTELGDLLSEDLQLGYSAFRLRHGIEVFDILSDGAKERMRAKLLEMIKQKSYLSISSYEEDIARFDAKAEVASKLEDELKELQSMEELFRKYPGKIFEEGYIAADNLHIQDMVAKFLVRRQNNERDNILYEKMQKHGLIAANA